MSHMCQGLATIRHKTVTFCSKAVPFTNQTRLTFDVLLQLWGPHSPHPSPQLLVTTSRLLCATLLEKGRDDNSMNVCTGGRPMASEGPPHDEEIVCL